MKFDRNSNIYTIIFTVVLVSVVAVILTAAYSFFKPFYEKNKRQEKMTDILYTLGIDKESLEDIAKTKGLGLSYELIEEYFEKYITHQIAVDYQGNEVEGVKVFEVNLKKEMSKPVEKQIFPLYIAEVEGKKYYIIPLQGKGLWDDIWGYVALGEDMNTIKGIKFGHKAETPGLGANITEKWFENRFIGEKLFDEQGNYVGIVAVKNYKNDQPGDGKIDVISGATLTVVGVEEMINERVKHYEPYFKKLRNKK